MVPSLLHNSRLQARAEGLGRLLAALPVAWLAATSLCAGANSALIAAGAARSESTVWVMLAGLLLWLALGLYACAARSLRRAWLLPLAVGLLGGAMLWLFKAGGAS